jgi:hypothetical protein
VAIIMGWKPASIEEVKQITDVGLTGCTTEQIAVFQQYRIQPHLASIMRSGKINRLQFSLETETKSSIGKMSRKAAISIDDVILDPDSTRMI